MKYIKKFFNKSKSKSQEEIDKQLYDAMTTTSGSKDHSIVIDALQKGANPNQVEDQDRGWEYSLLMIASADGDMKLVEELIKYGADVYFSAHQWKKENKWKNTNTIDDYWDWVNHIVFFEYRPKIKDIILKYHPNFFEERELKNTANKYNI